MPRHPRHVGHVWLTLLAVFVITTPEALAQDRGAGPATPSGSPPATRSAPSSFGSIFGQPYFAGPARTSASYAGLIGGYGSTGLYRGAGPSTSGRRSSAAGYGSGAAGKGASLPEYGGSQLPPWYTVHLLLTASGVPNDGGRLRWPLGLRLLGPEDGGALRGQTEALLQVAALQAQLGQVNPGIKREVRKDVGELQARLRVLNERGAMNDFTYEEAVRFLRRVKKAPEVIEQALTAPTGSYAELRTGAGW